MLCLLNFLKLAVKCQKAILFVTLNPLRQLVMSMLLLMGQ
ncbi:UNVERIFIED_CONTAM: hypothetical protein GTU68_027372 [Idotea baltica]|nr:hypothetical protein [Idotea baltica]